MVCLELWKENDKGKLNKIGRIKDSGEVIERIKGLLENEYSFVVRTDKGQLLEDNL